MRSGLECPLKELSLKESTAPDISLPTELINKILGLAVLDWHTAGICRSDKEQRIKQWLMQYSLVARNWTKGAQRLLLLHISVSAATWPKDKKRFIRKKLAGRIEHLRVKARGLSPELVEQLLRMCSPTGILEVITRHGWAGDVRHSLAYYTFARVTLLGHQARDEAIPSALNGRSLILSEGDTMRETQTSVLLASQISSDLTITDVANTHTLLGRFQLSRHTPDGMALARLECLTMRCTDSSLFTSEARQLVGFSSPLDFARTTPSLRTLRTIPEYLNLPPWRGGVLPPALRHLEVFSSPNSTELQSSPAYPREILDGIILRAIHESPSLHDLTVPPDLASEGVTEMCGRKGIKLIVA